MDENGQTAGPISGDQTGKEVAVATWYAKNGKGVGWSHYIELKDAAKREKLARFIEAACANPKIGYSQKNRTGLYESMKQGRTVDVASGDVDCTSLIFIGLKLACGISVAIGYSGNMAKLLTDTGKFNSYTDASHISTDNLAKRGGIYLRKGHALTVLEDGDGAGSGASASAPEEDYASEADQIDPPYVLALGSVNVRSGAGVDGNKIIYTAHRGEKLPFEEIDDDTGWYAVQTPNGYGFITNKPKYTKLVTE
jgi:hypothetical protein